MEGARIQGLGVSELPLNIQEQEGPWIQPKDL